MGKKRKNNMLLRPNAFCISGVTIMKDLIFPRINPTHQERASWKADISNDIKSPLALRTRNDA
jgi:hypothetical protein